MSGHRPPPRTCVQCGAGLVRFPEDPIALVCPVCPEVDPDEAREQWVFHGVPRTHSERAAAEQDAAAYAREHPLQGGK